MRNICNLCDTNKFLLCIKSLVGFDSMADTAISIMTKVAAYVVGPAIREGKYFLCVNKVVGDFEEEKKELISERDNLLNRVEQARERTEVIEEPVEKCLDEVRKLVKEVEDLEQKMKANTSCFQGWFPTWRRYRLCKQMIKKKEAMGKFKGKSNIQPFSHRAHLPGIQYQSSQNFTYFESTKVAYNQLMEALQDDCIYMIGVYGMGGCGKTTLVMEVGKMAEESNMFDKVISITVSQTPTIRYIQGIMADMLNMKLEEESEEGRAQRLWLSLKEKKRILIIVDDLWEEFNLKHIGIHLDKVNKGAWKILVTTRNQSVCTSMDCQKYIHLGLLSKKESWTLFQQRANIDNEFSESLYGVPRKLCEECTGLPIAIVTVASSLKGKHEAEWEVALDKLRNSEAFDEHDKGVSATLSCLELSYKYLQNKEAELLFLMCSMFPEDYNILIEDLILYAIGLGVGERSSLKSKRSLIQAGINKLLDSCLLMHVEGKQCVKMHDLVRDAALWMAKRLENRRILVNIDQPLNTLEEDDNIRKCFAVSSWWQNEDPSFSQLHAPNLEMLFLNTRISSNIFDLSGLTCERLQVFTLNHKTYTRVPVSFPPSTQLLKNVRTLRLNGLKLGDISFIASLTTLEVLDLRCCYFNELPDEIGKLGRLKLLDLSRCHIFQNNYNGAIGKCSQLEELYASEYDQKEEYLHQSTMDIVTLPNLQRFVIQTTGQDISHYLKSTRSLGVRDFNISKLRESKKNILQIAESVVLSGRNGGYKNIIPGIVGVVGGMNGLTNLFLIDCPEIECIFDTTSDSKVDDLIPRLVDLRLQKVRNLKELCRGPPLQVQCFFEKLEILQIEDCMQLHNIFPWECTLKNLKELTVQDCTSDEVLFPTSIGQSLQQLESLVISNCDELKHIIASGREHGGCNTSKEIVPALCPSNSHFPMPSLRKVCVYGCRKLESIFPVCYVEGLARLQEITISGSPELKYVFGECDHEHHSSQQYQNHTMLPHLEVLDLSGLQNLVGMCPEHCRAKWPSQSLRKLTVRSCPKLATSWIAVMTGSDQRQHRLNENLSLKLQELDLFGLPQLNFISCVGPPPPEQIWSLQYLARLKVNDCENLEYLFSMEVHRSLPELMFLSICNCQDMKHIIAANEEPAQLANAEVYFPKLEKVVVRNCEKLKSLFSMDVCRSLPKLRSLCIDCCNELEQIVATNEEPVQLPNAEAYFPKLKLVVVKNCEKLRSLFSMEVCRSLPKLMILCIDCCKELEQIVAANEETEQLPNAEVYFPKLKNVIVKKCNKLKSLFPVSMVRILPQLSNIYISKAAQLEEVFRHGCGDNSISVMEIVLPNLIKIALCYLPSFVDICQGCKLQAVKLEVLYMHKCPKTSSSLRAIHTALLPHQQRVLVTQEDEEEEEEENDDIYFLVHEEYSGICKVEDPDNVNSFF